MRRAVGILILVVALVAAVVYLSVMDPVGAKLADDADPFGDPGPRYIPVVGLVVSLSLAAVGAWLASGRKLGKPR